MRKLLIPGALLLLLALLSACDSGGKFRVVNRCEHPLYVRVGGGGETTIPGGAEHTFEVSTKTEHIFDPDVSREVPVRLVGETYQIYDDIEEAWTDSTTVVIKAGETLSAYIDPNRASVKIVNQSSLGIASATVFKHNFIAPTAIAVLDAIGSGESRFLRVDYATPNNNFYYYVFLVMDDQSTLTYGGETTVLDKDGQLLITLTDPEE
jgi:hypothetical protein